MGAGGGLSQPMSRGSLCWGARAPHWLFKHLPEVSPEFFCRSSCWQRCASGKDGKARLWGVVTTFVWDFSPLRRPQQAASPADPGACLRPGGRVRLESPAGAGLRGTLRPGAHSHSSSSVGRMESISANPQFFLPQNLPRAHLFLSDVFIIPPPPQIGMLWALSNNHFHSRHSLTFWGP